jgi:hypothetical protein
MKGLRLKLNIDLISLSSNPCVKAPVILRNRDYSSMPSPNSIKHRIKVIETQYKIPIEESKFDNTNYFYNHK